MPFSYVVADKIKLSKEKTSLLAKEWGQVRDRYLEDSEPVPILLRVNDSLTLEGIPPEVYHYRLGNRSALEWVIDQYRVTEDARSAPGAYATRLAINRGGRL